MSIASTPQNVGLRRLRPSEHPLLVQCPGGVGVLLALGMAVLLGAVVAVSVAVALATPVGVAVDVGTAVGDSLVVTSGGPRLTLAFPLFRTS